MTDAQLQKQLNNINDKLDTMFMTTMVQALSSVQNNLRQQLARKPKDVILTAQLERVDNDFNHLVGVYETKSKIWIKGLEKKYNIKFESLYRKK